MYNLITDNSWLVEKEALSSEKKANSTHFDEEEIALRLNLTTSFDANYRSADIANGVLAGFSDDKKYAVVLTAKKSLRLVEVDSANVVFTDVPSAGYVWSDSSSSRYEYKIDCVFIGNSLFAYKQTLKREDNSTDMGFIVKILNLSSMNVSTVAEKHGLSEWNISPDGQFLVYSAMIADSVNELTVYDIEKDSVVWKKREGKPRTEIVFSPDGVHFATTGSIFLGDETSHAVCIRNCFDSDESVTAQVSGTVDNMAFSNDGRRIAVSTNRNELYIFNVRDGAQAVLPRHFDKQIYDMAFSDDDNSVQVKFNGENGSVWKEYAIRVNKLNFDIIKSDIKPGIIYKTLLINENYICFLCSSLDRGLFLEVKNTHDPNDFYILPVQSDVKVFSQVNFIRLSENGTLLFMGIGNSAKAEPEAIDVYELNIPSNEYVSYKSRIFTEDEAKSYGLDRKNELHDKKGNTYVITDSNTVTISDSSGKTIKEIRFKDRVVSVSLDKHEKLLAAGISSQVIRSGIEEIEVRRLKDNAIVFRTEYQSKRPVSIKKFVFSDDATMLHAAGKYSSSDTGFYDAWDLSTGKKINESFALEIGEVKDFDVGGDGSVFLHTSFYTISKSLVGAQKNLSEELRGNAVYQLLGGWTLNDDDVPELVNFEDETKGGLALWLTSDKQAKTVHPASSTKLSDALPFFNTTSNRETILDIEPDNAQALDSYGFDVTDFTLEKNFKKDKSIDSWNDEFEIDNEWENEKSTRFWKMLSQDEEALKLYKFYADNYEKKVPNSVNPLKNIRTYYFAIGDEKKAQKVYNRMISEYPDTVYVKLLKLSYSDISPDEKNKIFGEMKKSDTAYMYDELKTLFDYYKGSLAMDSSLEEIKDTVDWLLAEFKKNLIETNFSNADKISGLFDGIATMTQFHKGGFGYCLDCIDYMTEGLSESQKFLLHLDNTALFVRMMNDIATGNDSDMEHVIESSDFAPSDIRKWSFMENLYMYYAMNGNPQKDSLLEQLLMLDKQYAHEFMTTGILTDTRIYKKLGNTNLCPADDKQKAFSLALELVTNRLQKGGTAGLPIEKVVSGGQADRAGLRKGDILLFYDEYPLSADTRDFFLYDLHTSEQKENKEQVQIIVLQNGRLRRVEVQEGLLGL